MRNVFLKPGREKSLERRHPWVFAGAVQRADNDLQPGETVDLRRGDGTFLARAAWSPNSQIAARVWTFDAGEEIGAEFFAARLKQALELRQALGITETTNAWRLVNAESDYVPGVIIDRYDEFLVCQFLSAGAERWKREIVRQLAELLPGAGIYERSDANVRAKEGLAPATGALLAPEPPDLVEIREGPCRFLVDVRRGQKTGFYLDQRDGRAALGGHVAEAEVLNCFAYTGAFGVWALKSSAARVTNVESSAGALALAQRHTDLNALDSARAEFVEGDAFQVLRGYRDRGRQFDIAILDPPKFADSKIQIPRAARGYKDINLLAFKLLRPGGILFTFSCSGLLAPDLFQKIVADAALDAGRDARVIGRLAQAADHPIALSFPEAGYLKGLVCRVA